jgi:hypothetical protein
MSIEVAVSSKLKQHLNNVLMLDAWIQWASNPTSKSADYGIEKNNSMINANLLHRYSLTREEANQYTAKLENESNELMKSGYGIYELRKEILRQLQGSAGETFRKALKEKIEKASIEAKNFTCLLYTLESQGFDALQFSASWENLKEKLLAYFKAAYGSLLSATAFDEILRIGVWNKLIWISSGRSGEEIQYKIAPHPSLEEIGLCGLNLGQQREVETLIERLFKERKFEELRVLDEVSREKFGYKTFYGEMPSVEGISSLSGVYGNVVAISPFLLDQIKDSLHVQKQNRIKNISQVIENKMAQLNNELWPECDITSTGIQGGQFLWRVDSSIYPRLHVYLTNWLTETDLRSLFPERSTNAIFVILNQSIPSAKHLLFSKIAYHNYLELIFPVQDDFRLEKATGERYGYANRIIQLITGDNTSGQPSTVNAKTSFEQEQSTKQNPTAEFESTSFAAKSPNLEGPNVENVKKSNEPLFSKPAQVCATTLSVLLGSNSAGNVFWAPATERNWSIAIVGSAGTGKTQTLKGILHELEKYKVPYLLFDFRNDYSERGSITSEFGKILDLNKISVNPFEIDASNTPIDQKFQVSDIIDLVYKLGAVQISYVRDAIRQAYREKGIFDEKQESWVKPAPTFTDVRRALENFAEEGTSEIRSAVKGIFARLDPIFEYQIFSGTTIIPFEELIKGQTIINLGILPSDSLKAIVCEFMLRKLRYYLYSLSESRDPRLFAVIDEAHRLKYERETSAGTLLKEGRKYGIGLVLATQDPVDFTELVYNNVGATLSLQLNEPKYAKNVAEKIGVSGESLKDGLSEKFSAYIRFSNFPKPIKFKIKPYYERVSNS